MKTLEHLLDPQFDEWDDADVSTVMGGQAATADAFLQEIGSPEHLLGQDSAERARTAFAAVTNPNQTEADKKRALAALKVPQAVKHLAGMLSQYDWDFVEQAKEIRGYVVAKVMEETTHPDAKIRLRALQLLGTVTEVGSFTERVQVTKVDATADELTDRIRAKRAALLPKVVEVETLEPKNDAPDAS